MRLSSNKLKRIKEIIRRHAVLLTEMLIGGVQSELSKKLGIPIKAFDMLGYAYAYGKLQAMSPVDISAMPVYAIDNLVGKTKLSRRQTEVLNLLKTKASTYAENFGNRVAATTVNSLIEASLSATTDNPATGINLALKELRQETRDFTRDWHRIVQTETWDAKLQGEVVAIADREGPYSNKGMDTLVFKRPHMATACPHCRRLYLEDDGITPRVFKLSEMKAFGDNIGRKTAQWKPVVGCLHPFCQCVLHVMPDGYHFNPVGQLEPD